jgi:L-ribulose-5-phosphate 3-epimerase
MKLPTSPALPFIGSIQGRLLPPVDGRIQAFPTGKWEQEFSLLQSVGYTSIELTIDRASWDEHPINSAETRERLSELSDEFGIATTGICCDIFMELPLLSPEDEVSSHARSILQQLLHNSAEARLGFVELPFMGDNSLKGLGAYARLQRVLDLALPIAEERGIDILFETDLDPEKLARLFGGWAHPRLGLNYDTGNSTWFGFNPVAELDSCHQYIRNVHIKDCTRADYSVPLGSGETQFDTIMDSLQRFGYRGGFIIQGARRPDDIAAARDYLKFTSQLLGKYFSSAANV